MCRNFYFKHYRVRYAKIYVTKRSVDIDFDTVILKQNSESEKEPFVKRLNVRKSEGAPGGKNKTAVDQTYINDKILPLVDTISKCLNAIENVRAYFQISGLLQCSKFQKLWTLADICVP